MAKLSEKVINCIVGWLYYEGIGVSKDHNKAYHFLTISAKEEFSPAAWLLRCLYRWGHGVERHQGMSDNWCHKAMEDPKSVEYFFLPWARNDQPLAQLLLGLFYYQQQNYAAAALWIHRSMKKGTMYAKTQMAIMYYEGKGVRHDIPRGTNLLIEAANDKDLFAEAYLGMIFINQQEGESAFLCFKDAAEAGICEAQTNLGCCYEHGIGTDKDDDLAEYWYRKASSQGSIVAYNNLKNLLKVN